MIHLGDITKISGFTAPVVDVITGGSPCQDLSVAGKRAGLDGERSGLFMEQIRIVKEMRQHDRDNGRSGVYVRPRFCIWENVPGAFSSNGGKDFQAVLTEFARIAEPGAPDVPMPEKGKWPKSGCIYAEMGGWSIAWRVHDAQFWGVPQRRKRIALVADFGGLSAPEILFERKGLRGDFEEGREERKGTAEGTENGIGSAISFQERAGCPGGGKGILIQNERTASIRTQNNQAVFPIEGNGARPSHRGDGWAEREQMFTLNTTEVHAVSYNIGSYHSNAWKSDNPHSGVYETEVSKTLDALNCGAPTCNQGGTAILCLNDQGGSVMSVSEDVSGCLRAQEHGHQPIVAGFCTEHSANSRGIGYEEEKSPTLRAGIVPACIDSSTEPLCIEMTSTKNTIVEDGISPTLTARMGTGGNQVNAVLDAVITFADIPHMTIDAEGVAFSLTNRDYKSPPCVTAPLGLDRASYNQGANAKFDFTILEDKQPTLTAKGPGAVNSNAVVRRLTPLECERLQGFPDNWTDIGDWTDSKGKLHKAADSPRYKALGNSIGLPFWAYLARRICAQYERPITMASLFDGIGGFPLVFERCGAKAVWASEIEEFPIAVTKIRFSE